MRILITGGSGFIGTNFIDEISREANTILNYSLHPPLKAEHKQYWRAGDILDPAATTAAFQEFQPRGVLHLAARAECDEKTTVEEGYRTNTEGTQNVLEAIRTTPSVQRAIVTSSQFVCAPGRLPKNDTDYFSETVYGQSKVITEKLTRDANLSACWTIIRPTNIWGPWHMRYRREFWRVVERGLYVHPGHQPVIRCYGYVKNVVASDSENFRGRCRSCPRPNILSRRSPDQSLRLGQWFLPRTHRTRMCVSCRAQSCVRFALIGRHSHVADWQSVSHQQFAISQHDYKLRNSYGADIRVIRRKSLHSGRWNQRETVKWLRACRDFSGVGGGS